MSYNRLATRIDTIQRRIDSGTVPKEKLGALDKSLSTPFSDLVQYQDLQAQAFALGKITFEEADSLYNFLGREVPSEEKWNAQPLAVKAAVTQMMDELLEWRIKLGKSGTHVVKYTVNPASNTAGKKAGGEAGIGGTR